MAQITLGQLFAYKRAFDTGLANISTDPTILAGGDINALFSFIEGLLKAAGFTDSSTLDLDDTTKKLLNIQEAARILNQIVSNFYTCTGTDAYELVPPASNTNLFPNALVSGRSVFIFLIPNSNTNSNITLSIPTVTTTPLKIFKSDGTTLFAISEFTGGSIAPCIYDETLDSGNGGFKTALSYDLTQIQNTYAPINSPQIQGSLTMKAGVSTSEGSALQFRSPSNNSSLFYWQAHDPLGIGYNARLVTNWSGVVSEPIRVTSNVDGTINNTFIQNGATNTPAAGDNSLRIATTSFVNNIKLQVGSRVTIPYNSTFVAPQRGIVNAITTTATNNNMTITVDGVAVCVQGGGASNSFAITVGSGQVITNTVGPLSGFNSLVFIPEF